MPRPRRSAQTWKPPTTRCLRKATEQTKIVNALKDQDTSEIESQMANAEQINRKVRENAKHVELKSLVEAKLQEWKDATSEIEAIDAQKQKMREEAKWPVPGLGYDENGVTFDAIPFDQVSSSRQRKVAMRICASLNPTLRFAFIKDGGLLDAKGLIEVAQYAAEVGIQLFVERVGKGAECNIVIEGGEVESVDGVPVAKDEKAEAHELSELRKAALPLHMETSRRRPSRSCAVETKRGGKRLGTRKPLSSGTGGNARKGW